MSFAAPLPPPTRFGGALLRGPTLTAMGRTVGIIGAAGAMAAIYQVAGSEMQRSLEGYRARTALVRSRHEAVRLEMLSTAMTERVQRIIIGSRNAYKAAFAVLVDPDTSDEDRQAVRGALLRATRTRTE